MKKSIIAGLLCLSFQYASAETTQMMSCQLQTGKTILDLTAWWDRWRSISDKAGFKDYKVKVGLPHTFSANQGVTPETVWMIHSSPSFDRYGAAWEWWYTSPKTQSMNTEFQTICVNTSNTLMQVIGAY